MASITIHGARRITQGMQLLLAMWLLLAFAACGGSSSGGGEAPPPAKPAATIPDAPQGVTATAANGQVSVAWENVTGATSYTIYFSTSAGVTPDNGTAITGPVNPYPHVALTNGVTYYYVVTASNAAGEGNPSAEVNATPDEQGFKVSFNAPVLGTTTGMDVFVFSGGTFVAGNFNVSVTAGVGKAVMYTGSSDIDSATVSSTETAQLSNGDYTLVVLSDQSHDGLAAGNADDLAYLGTVTVSDPNATVALTDADFLTLVSHGVSFTGQAAIANQPFFCFYHLPGGDPVHDKVQRTLFGGAVGIADGSGAGTSSSSLAIQGDYDVTCISDAIGSRVYDYLSSGIGLESGTDYVATATGITVDGSGTVLSASFAAATETTGSVGCTGTKQSGGNGSVGGGTYDGDNNSAVLAGSSCTLGQGITGIASLRKTIAATDTSSNSDFTVGTAYATRPTALDDVMYPVIAVTNASATAQCFVKLAALTYKNGSGTVIEGGPSSLDYVAGSVGDLTTIQTDTCLAPGETGYALDIQLSGFTAVASVEFALVTTGVPTQPTVKIIPQSFEAFGNSVWIPAKNVGSSNGQIGGFSQLLHLDGSGLPMGWDFIDDVLWRMGQGSSIAKAGGDPRTSVTFISHEGAISKVRLFVDWDATASAGTFLSAPVDDATAAQLQAVQSSRAERYARYRYLRDLRAGATYQPPRYLH